MGLGLKIYQCLKFICRLHGNSTYKRIRPINRIFQI